MNNTKLSPEYFAVSILLLLCATVAFAADDLADALARTVLAKAGVHATICEMPRVGDGTLAAALAKAGIAQVHALATDNTAAEGARKPAIAAGVMGSQVIIETGTPDAFPLADWVADLYVAVDATDANLTSLSAAEAGRVLSPYRGVAVVGNPAGAKGGLSKAALASWAEGTGGTATITEDASGLWAVVKMLPLAGGDDWSHYYHGPDGNPVSKDKAFRTAPFELQWFGKPSLKNASDITLAAAGRIFILSCTDPESGTGRTTPRGLRNSGLATFTTAASCGGGRWRRTSGESARWQSLPPIVSFSRTRTACWSSTRKRAPRSNASQSPRTNWTVSGLPCPTVCC